jgi:hypothetical protein
MQSTVDVLYHLCGKLIVGGYVIMEDWNEFPSKDASRASKRQGPAYQSILVDFSIILSPTHPEIGMKGILAGL